MKVRFWRRRRLDPLPELEEREANKFERQYAEEQGSANAVVKKMGRENLEPRSSKTDDSRLRQCSGMTPEPQWRGPALVRRGTCRRDRTVVSVEVLWDERGQFGAPARPVVLAVLGCHNTVVCADGAFRRVIGRAWRAFRLWREADENQKAIERRWFASAPVTGRGSLRVSFASLRVFRLGVLRVLGRYIGRVSDRAARRSPRFESVDDGRNHCDYSDQDGGQGDQSGATTQHVRMLGLGLGGDNLYRERAVAN